MTDTSPTSRWALLPGIVLALVLAGGLASGVMALLSPAGRGVLGEADLDGIVLGRVTAEISHLQNEQLLGGRALADAARVIDWLALGDLGPEVRQGCPGWLFLREELDIHPAPEAAMARRADIVARIAAQLRARGIALVVAVAPDKSRIESQARCGLARSAALEGRLAEFNALLARRGVEAVDLAAALSALDGERYFRSDTHWNERGAQAAAKAVAARLASQGIAPAGAAQVTPGQPAERLGDLIRLAGLDAVPAWARPAGDRVAASTIVPPSMPGDDLLGETAGPPVVVIGSSFSRNANFIGFLAAALSAPVGDMARDGAGFDGAARAYFANAAFRESPPRVIVWEMPERVLDAPAGEAERAWTGDLPP